LVRLKDIAEYLHVSVSTVSRVVNNQNRVDPVTRQKILEALKKFKYQPDENARRLKTNTSNVIGVIVPDISNPYFGMVIKGIERIANQNGFTVILCNTGENVDHEKNAIRLLIRQKIAALIVSTTMDIKDIEYNYFDLDFPIVFFDNVPDTNFQINLVTINNILAANDLVRDMLKNGHKRIFMITGPKGESSADERLTGWRKGLQEAGIEPGEGWAMHGDFLEESGAQIMQKFLERKDRPTAVCIANNFMTYGAVKAIFAAGLTIPDDISVGVFDVVDTTGLMKLDFTTIVEPAEDIGKIAAEICIKNRISANIKVCQKMVLMHTLKHGGTIKNLLATP
jgi:DNA-binding LacI/PurR family transcriptional regulator